MDTKNSSQMLISRICDAYLAEHPELSRARFSQAWQEMSPILAMGQKVEIEPPTSAESESMFGTAMDPWVEAILLGIIANFATDGLKWGVKKARERISSPEWRAKYAKSIGIARDKSYEIAKSILAWLHENWDRQWPDN